MANSNLLIKLDDAVGPGYNEGFADGADNPVEYEYDTHGNMVRDDNKGITSIRYNHLNLPVEILFTGGAKIQYIYNSEGKKLEKKVEQGSTSNTTKYLEGFQYVDNQLQMFPHPEGYVAVSGSQYRYVFQYKDHLGNVRLSYARDPDTGNARIVEEQHYYPFGLQHSGYNQDMWMSQANAEGQKYKYSGMEWQEELGLNFYDFGARNYDPAIGRWMNVDPLAENSRRWNPYNYAYNNPIYFIDPDGMQADTFSVNDVGEITKLDEEKYYDKNGNEVDKLIKGDKILDKEGNMLNNSVDVKKGVLENKEELKLEVVSNDNNKEIKKEFKGYKLNFGNNVGNAREVFEFLAKNTKSEFSFNIVSHQNNISITQSYITTSLERDKEVFGTGIAIRAASMGKLVENTHNHPSNSSSASDDDLAFSNRVNTSLNSFKTNFPSQKYFRPKLSIYTISNGYKQYN